MRRLVSTVGVLLSLAACGDDDAALGPVRQPDAGPKDEARETAGQVGLDGGQTPLDAGVPSARLDASALDAQRPADRSRPDPNAPPATQNGKKLYTVRFDSRAGEQPFACGKKVALGTKGTWAEPIDLRWFVHDVTLLRASGERVPLELHQDERYQRENVALLDFVDDTGGCLTGDADIRNVVHGYAPEQADYTGLAFKVGVPPDKNHLDGAHAPAPYNASSMWWSWSGGYKYMRIDLTSDVLPIWFFHGGGADCGGTTATGFSCTSKQIASIELPGYDPQGSLVVFDAARFYAASDLTVADGTPGCMGFAPDSQCAPLYNTLGVTPWDDTTPGPKQTAFVLTTGAAVVASKGKTAPERKVDDPTAWPDPTYQRPAAFDIENISRALGTRSHPADDPRYGANCMRCHQDKGPGLGKFSAAGTLADATGKPATAGKVEIFSGDRVGYGKFENVVSHAIIDVDAYGNFFTTAALPLDTTEVSARVLGTDGTPLITMPFAQQTAACNNCHAGGARLTLPKP